MRPPGLSLETCFSRKAGRTYIEVRDRGFIFASKLLFLGGCSFSGWRGDELSAIGKFSDERAARWFLSPSGVVVDWIADCGLWDCDIYPDCGFLDSRMQVMGRLSDSATILCARRNDVLTIFYDSECLAALGIGSRFPIGYYPTAKTVTFH